MSLVIERLYLFHANVFSSLNIGAANTYWTAPFEVYIIFIPT